MFNNDSRQVLQAERRGIEAELAQARAELQQLRSNKNDISCAALPSTADADKQSWTCFLQTCPLAGLTVSSLLASHQVLFRVLLQSFTYHRLELCLLQAPSVLDPSVLDRLVQLPWMSDSFQTDVLSVGQPDDLHEVATLPPQQLSLMCRVSLALHIGSTVHHAAVVGDAVLTGTDAHSWRL